MPLADDVVYDPGDHRTVAAQGAPLLSWWLITSRDWREWRVEKLPRIEAAARSARPIIDALRACRAEHGQYPQTLEELVPEYLDAVPTPPPPIREGWVYVPLEEREKFMLWGSPGQNYSGVLPMPPSNAEFLTYESDGTYGLHPLNAGAEWATAQGYEPWQRIGDWAYYR